MILSQEYIKSFINTLVVTGNIDEEQAKSLKDTYIKGIECINLCHKLKVENKRLKNDNKLLTNRNVKLLQENDKLITANKSIQANNSIYALCCNVAELERNLQDFMAYCEATQQVNDNKLCEKETKHIIIESIYNYLDESLNNRLRNALLRELLQSNSISANSTFEERYNAIMKYIVANADISGLRNIGSKTCEEYNSIRLQILFMLSRCNMQI